jgi:hypothetical protein
MRKLILTMAGLAALATTSIAVAHGIEGAKTAKAVAATRNVVGDDHDTMVYDNRRQVDLGDGREVHRRRRRRHRSCRPDHPAHAQRHQHDRQGRGRAWRVPHRCRRP